jgi:BON domain
MSREKRRQHFGRIRPTWEPKRQQPSSRWSAESFLGGAVVGGALAYLLDPAHGRRRRRLLADRSAGMARRSSREATRTMRIAAGRAQGRTRGLIHRLRPRDAEPVDDVELVHKVESLVFRDPKLPKGQVSINAEQGEVFLRGQVEQPELIRDLEEAVRKVPGVRRVENLLHLPGTATPKSRPGRLAR